MSRNKGRKEIIKDTSSQKNKNQAGLKGPSGVSASTASIAKILLLIMLVGLTLLLLIGPFYRGLFFTEDLLFAQAAIFFLFIFWGVYRILTREKELIKSPLDLCLILLLFAYALSYFVAVHKRFALEEILKIASYLAVYLVAIEICRNLYFGKRGAEPKEKTENQPEQLPPGLGLMLHILMVVATIITIASLGVAAGHWDFIGAYHDAGLRIASPMGYSNTAAAYFMAAYLLTVALAPLAQKRWLRSLYLAPAAFILIATILTFSRGAWLLLAPLMVLLILAAAPGQRLRALLFMVATAVPALPAAFLADPLFRSLNPAQAWLPIVAAVFGAAALGLVAEFYLGQSLRTKLITLSTAVLASAAVLVWFVVIPLVGPINLQYHLDGQGEKRSVEQVVNNVISGETYQIKFEVKTKEGVISDQFWSVEVHGGRSGYQSTELFSYEGGATKGWEKKSFSFEPTDDLDRLEVRFYAGNYGTSVFLKSVKLLSGSEEKSLHFILNRILPDRYYNRMISYDRERNLGTRIEMFRDAAKIIRDYSLLGAGGGGWAALYQGYQDRPLQGRPYFSSEVHNHFLQVWIEAGILGFLAFVGIWISMATAFIRNCFINRADSKRWQYWTAVFLPVAALGAHSVIDWNFSMAAVGIFLFTLLGAGSSLDTVAWFKGKVRPEGTPGKIGPSSIVLLAVGIILFTWNLILIGGFNSTARSQEYIEQRNIKMAVPELQRAIRLDPLRAENYHNLGVILEEQSRAAQSSADLEAIIFLAGRAYQLEPFNPLYIFRHGEFMLNYVDIRSGLDTLDRLMAVRPLSVNSYIQASLARLRIAEYIFNSGNPSEGIKYLNEIDDIKLQMQERYGETEQLNYILGRVQLLRGDSRQARLLFNAVKERDQFYELAQQQLQLLEE